MYHIYANLLPLLKHNLEIISCLMLSGETCISITCAHSSPPSLITSCCWVAQQADEHIPSNEINEVQGSFIHTV